MSLFGREQRPVYRVYAEDEYDDNGEPFGDEARTESVGVEGQTHSFAASAEMESDGALGAEPAGVDRSPIDSRRPHQAALTAGSLELRRRPVAFLVVGLVVLVVAIVVVLVLSSASQRAPRRSTSAAPAVSAGHSRVTTAPPMPMSTPARRNPARVSPRSRRPSAAARVPTGGDVPAFVVMPIPAAGGRPLPESPPASVVAEFGFER